MNNRAFISMLVVFALCVAGFGFYRGWFVLSSPNSGTESNQVNVNLTVNRGKMKADAESVKRKTKELTGKATN